ncbi:2Fe-2S iron-sulfur cluster-binding protein [Sphingobium naphthae]|nr:2Fe-2S iron-sulfur cluster-binding protein [Sphingobium naphthae]
MKKLYVIAPLGKERIVEAGLDQTVMEAIRDAGIDELAAMCGGCCACATCHVQFDKVAFSSLPPIGRAEDDLLSSSDHRSRTSRLSCQVQVAGLPDGSKIWVVPSD